MVEQENNKWWENLPPGFFKNSEKIIDFSLSTKWLTDQLNYKCADKELNEYIKNMSRNQWVTLQVSNSSANT